MRTPKHAFLVASSIVLALPITGCALGGERPSGFANRVDKGSIGVALRAQAALEAGDTAAAIRLAEQAVENSPGDAGFRSLLGNAYFAAGRFRSAEAAYGDALALIPGQAGVPLRLALAQAALGKSDSALATLETWQQQIDSADAGLALALAGRPGAAVELLDLVARQPGADARVRQNLALAHALAGDWVRARSIAAQDVPGDQLEARMSEWAALARPAQPGSQVAALIGVPAAAGDEGQPERLALRSASKAVRLAAQGKAPVAEPAVEGSASAPAPVAVAASEPALEPVAAFAPEPQPVATPEPLAVPEPVAAPDVAEMLDSIRREPVRASGALPRVSELRRSAARRYSQNQTVVQLGAYATQSGVRSGWTVVSRRHQALRSYVPASSRFDGPAGTVYRLSLKGFASDREARQLCMTIKASGGSCFVRNAAGDAPVRFATR
jgi:Flp pilus assembly protein TadD